MKKYKIVDTVFMNLENNKKKNAKIAIRSSQM